MRTQTIPQQTVVEDIVSIDHNIGNFVRLLIGKGTVVNEKFELLPSQNLEAVVIADIPGGYLSMGGYRTDITDYTELMSAYPTWSPQKPAGVFRKEDLWHFVDLIRSRS